MLEKVAERTGTVAWAADGRTLFYTVEEEATKRQHRLYRHALGTPGQGLIYEERDPAFNVGVELGQVAIIGLCLVTFGFWFRNRDWYRNLFVIPASIFIAAVGLFWTFDRLE